jgi:hypothetical protein
MASSVKVTDDGKGFVSVEPPQPSFIDRRYMWLLILTVACLANCLVSYRLERYAQERWINEREMRLRNRIPHNLKSPSVEERLSDFKEELHSESRMYWCIGSGLGFFFFLTCWIVYTRNDQGIT